MSCPKKLEKFTAWIYRNVFFLLALVVGFLVVIFIPQVYNIWYSGPPPFEMKAVPWITGWVLFLLFLIFGALFTLISVYAVPRPYASVAKVKLPRLVTKCVPRWVQKVFREVYRVIDQSVSILPWLVMKIPRTGLAILSSALIACGFLHYRIFPDLNVASPYLLCAPFAGNVVGWMVCLGIWLAFCVCLADTARLGSRLSEVTAQDGTHQDFNRTDFWTETMNISGRFLTWIVLTFLVAELLWFGSLNEATSAVVSLRAYSVWMILYAWGVALVFSQCVDYLDLRFPYAPLRILSLLLLGGLALTLKPPANLNVVVMEAAPDGSSSVDGFTQLEARLRSIPSNQPILIVAASGGGSRAAIFTSLVYEFLARRPLSKSLVEQGNDTRESPTWADNIVMISTVSGGSLATAHFVQRECQRSRDQLHTRNTISEELFSRFKTEVGRLIQDERDRIEGEKSKLASAAPDERAKRLRDLAKDELDSADAEQRLQKLLGEITTWRETDDMSNASIPSDAWILFGEFADDMCTNFMAAILRGATSFTFDRGESLCRFWEGLFRWEHATNLTFSGTPPSDSSLEGLRSSKSPLVLYNACDVEMGSRIAIGFPPLPADAFVSRSYKATRPAPVELAHVFREEYRDTASDAPDTQDQPEDVSHDEIVSISLANAVRLSSNFPWGFHAARIRSKVGQERRMPLERMVLDGGVADNTGIDTIYEILRGFHTTEHQRNERILNLLRTRRVVFVEIDSGAKPLPPSSLEKRFGVLLEPLRALGNASYTNADLSKENYLRAIKEILSIKQFYDSGDESAESTLTREQAEEREQILEALEEILPTGHSEPVNFTLITISCNHFSPQSPDKSAVMTAFALGPADKASVTARFAYELFKLEELISRVEDNMDDFLSLRQEADNLFPERSAVLYADAVEDWAPQAENLETILETLNVDELDSDQLEELEAIAKPYQMSAKYIEQRTQQSSNDEALMERTALDPEQLDEKLQQWEKVIGSKLPRVKEIEMRVQPPKATKAVPEAAESLKAAQKSIREMNHRSQEWFKGERPAKR